jgi:serine phosphatase RsbU (regulator of sigma subunit)
VPFSPPGYEVLGIIQSDPNDLARIRRADLKVLPTSSRAAILIQNAVMHESLLEGDRLSRDLRVAAVVQRQFLPQSVPAIPAYEFFAHYNPAHVVGGDFYDFVPLPDDRLAVAVGDVAGNGVAAALLMARFSRDARHCILAKDSPSAAASELNRVLCSEGIEESFVTLSLSVLDIEKRTLSLASAGHLPVLIRRANGTVDEIGAEVTGFPLGILRESNYRETKVELHPGDVVAAFTDGVTDARNPLDQLYDSEDNRRLRTRLSETQGGPAAVGRAILEDIREFSSEPVHVDDVTLLCFGPLQP